MKVAYFPSSAEDSFSDPARMLAYDFKGWCRYSVGNPACQLGWPGRFTVSRVAPTLCEYLVDTGYERFLVTLQP